MVIQVHLWQASDGIWIASNDLELADLNCTAKSN
jgi:hypothetical protein